MQTAPFSVRSRLPWIIVAAAALLLALVLSGSRDIQRDPPQLSGALWRAGTAEAPVLAYITMEERAKSVPIVGRSRSFQYRAYSRFELVTRRIPTGEVVQVQRLADLKGYSDEKAPTILGVAGDLLWIWRDSLEGYSLPNLALQVTPSTLVATSPSTRDALPVESKGYRMTGALGTLVARGRDARLYRIDASPAAISRLDPAELPPTHNSMRVEDRFDYIIPPQRHQVTTDPATVMQKSFVTKTGEWYALLSPSEREGLTPWPSAEDRPFGAVARSLYRAPYRLDGRGYPAIDLRTVRRVGEDRLIQAAFAIRGSRAVWDVPEPSSSLVIAKSRLGDQEPWEVLRLTRDGRVLWRTSIGMTTTWAFLDLGTHVAFYGPFLEEKPGDRHEQVVWIDERTGARHALALASGEVTSGAAAEPQGK